MPFSNNPNSAISILLTNTARTTYQNVIVPPKNRVGFEPTVGVLQTPSLPLAERFKDGVTD